MKKRILCLLIGVTMLFSVGCGKKEEEIDPIAQDTIDKIEILGDITLDDEDMIVKLEKTYSEMTEKQKNQVKNYIDLKNAREELDELKEKEAAEEAALQDEKYLEVREYYSEVDKAISAIKKELKNQSSLVVNDVLVESVDGNKPNNSLYLISFTAENGFGANMDEICYYTAAYGTCNFSSEKSYVSGMYDNCEDAVNGKDGYKSDDGIFYSYTENGTTYVRFRIDLDDYKSQGFSLD